jgi:hypothetical protein
MIGSLFGRKNDDGTTTGGLTGTHKAVGGALLAAGAAYLYKRYKNGSLNVPNVSNNN